MAGQAASALHSMAVLQVFQTKMLTNEEAGLDSAFVRDLRSATELALRATKATDNAIRHSMASLIVLECHLWLTMTEMKEADKVPFLGAPVSSGSLFGQLWRVLLNASRRLRSHLRQCNTSSLNAPALTLLQVTPDLRRLSRQLNQRQAPRSPDLLKIGEIEGARARHNAAPSRSAKDPSPRSPWVWHLSNLPEQPGRKRRGPSLATTGPPSKQALLCLSAPHLELGAEEILFIHPHGSAIAPRCSTAVIADKKKQTDILKKRAARTLKSFAQR